MLNFFFFMVSWGPRLLQELVSSAILCNKLNCKEDLLSKRPLASTRECYPQDAKDNLRSLASTLVARELLKGHTHLPTQRGFPCNYCDKAEIIMNYQIAWAGETSICEAHAQQLHARKADHCRVASFLVPLKNRDCYFRTLAVSEEAKTP